MIIQAPATAEEFRQRRRGILHALESSAQALRVGAMLVLADALDRHPCLLGLRAAELPIGDSLEYRLTLIAYLQDPRDGQRRYCQDAIENFEDGSWPIGKAGLNAAQNEIEAAGTELFEHLTAQEAHDIDRMGDIDIPAARDAGSIAHAMGLSGLAAEVERAQMEASVREPSLASLSPSL